MSTAYCLNISLPRAESISRPSHYRGRRISEDGPLLLVSVFSNIYTTILSYDRHLPITSSVVLPEKLCDLRSHLSRSLQAWITYRFDILSASSTLLLTLLAIYTNISPGLTAFVLTASASCRSNPSSLSYYNI